MNKTKAINANLKNLDKSEWKTYRFDEIAQSITEKVDPKKTDLEVYIGLEHLDAESIHIKRQGTKDDVKGVKIRCYPGDVIFGKRRAYQRKAAIVTFDGFCSAHSMVLRAKPEVIDPKLFPFFLHSNAFMHRAIDISVGSLSPTINWGTLKTQTFMLPPKNQQAQLAELLWAMDEVVEKEMKVLERLGRVYQAMVDDFFSRNQQDWEYLPLDKIALINKESLKSGTLPDYEFKYLDIAGITEPKVIGELKVLKFSDSPNRARRIVNDGNIVLSLVRPYHKSFVFVENSKDMIASTGTGVIEVKKGYNNRFIFHQFFSGKFMRYCENVMTGTNYPAITPNDLKKYKVGMPNEDSLPEKITFKLDSMDIRVTKTKSKIQTSKTLQKSLINQIF